MRLRESDGSRLVRYELLINSQVAGSRSHRSEVAESSHRIGDRGFSSIFPTGDGSHGAVLVAARASVTAADDAVALLSSLRHG